MFRSNFQLTAGVFPYQFPKKSVVWVGKQIIKPDAGTDKDFLHLGQLSQLPENVQIFRMVGVNCLPLQSPFVSCFLQDGARKFAVGPPTS